MTSIRRTLATRLIISLGIVALVIGAALFLGIRAALTRQFDRTLMARLGAMQSATRWDGSRLDVDFTPEAMPWYAAGPACEFFEIRSAGEPASKLDFTRSPSLKAAAWDAPFQQPVGVFDLTLPDGRSGRAMVAAFRPLPEEELDRPGQEAARRHAADSSPSVRLAVAIDRRGLDEALRVVAVGLLASGGVMALGVLFAVRSSIARGLRPLDALSAQVGKIRIDSLSTRLDGGGLPRELGPIHARLNELLQHLDEAFAREQRFTAAAAHELRTPVAELRSLIEVSLSRPRTAEEHRAALGESLDITLRAEHLVATLLRLARARGAPDTLETMSISPAAILQQVAARHAPAARKAGGEINVTIRSHAHARADAGALESVLENVIANAVEYSQPAPLVDCDVQDGARGSVVVSVRNPITGIQPEDVERFFEPFWRRSQSRTPSTHLGMGLVIARSLMQEMGGSIQASLEDAHLLIRMEFGNTTKRG